MKEDIVTIYDLLREAIYEMLNDPSIVKTRDQRTLQGLHLLGEATQNLYAACINLDFIEKDSEPVHQNRPPID